MRAIVCTNAINADDRFLHSVVVYNHGGHGHLHGDDSFGGRYQSAGLLRVPPQTTNVRFVPVSTGKHICYHPMTNTHP